MITKKVPWKNLKLEKKKNIKKIFNKLTRNTRNNRKKRFLPYYFAIKQEKKNIQISCTHQNTPKSFLNSNKFDHRPSTRYTHIGVASFTQP